MNDVIDILWSDYFEEWLQVVEIDGRQGVSRVQDKDGLRFYPYELTWYDNSGRAWDDLTDEEQKQWLP